MLTCHRYEDLTPNCLASCPDDFSLPTCSAPSHLEPRVHLLFASTVPRLDDSESRNIASRRTNVIRSIAGIGYCFNADDRGRECSVT